MVVIPTNPIPSQLFSIVLGEYNCTFKLYQKGIRMFMDLYTENAPIFTGNVCLSSSIINNVSNNNFTGVLTFLDLLGDEAPFYSGLNSRFRLLYFYPDEEIPGALT